MTARKRSVLLAAVCFITGAAVLASVVTIATAAPDPVVVLDHADRTVTVGGSDAPVLAFRPTRAAQFRAFAKLTGENTGGAWLAALAAIGIRRARGKWPRLRRGWTDEVSATAFVSFAWVATSLATGATWATAALGVIMAALAGGLMAMIPGEKPGGAL